MESTTTKKWVERRMNLLPGVMGGVCVCFISTIIRHCVFGHEEIIGGNDFKFVPKLTQKKLYLTLELKINLI